MKKKTYDEYVQEVAIKNPNVEVIGEYVNTNTKTKHRCLVHDVYWDTTPARILQGIGCEMCRKDKFRKVRCKTHKQYIKEIEEINPNIEVVGEYIDAKTPIKHYCKKHNIFWDSHPDNILKGCGCVECGKEKIGDKNRKSHEQYVDELQRNNSNIAVVGVYINANTPILHRCLIDGYEWDVSPANILFGKGCPKCSNNIKRTHEEYVNEVKKINPHIEVLEEYVNSNTPILHKCKIHNVEWKVVPNSVIQGSGCLECGKEKLKRKLTKTHQCYVEELKEENPNVIVLEEYKGAYVQILHKCLIDGNEWYTTPTSMLLGNGCPQCHESKGEKEIRKLLDKYNITYEPQYKFDDCRDTRTLPFDFYLPDYNSCIEYQGKQHYESIEYFGGQEQLEYIQKHDNIKSEYCKNNGISLLCIPYFKNIEEELDNFLFI